MNPRSTAKKKKTVIQGPTRSPVRRPDVRQDRRFDYVWAAIIFLLALALYSNTISHGYVLDDYGVLRDDFRVKRGIQGIPMILETPYRYEASNLSDNLYRPLSQVMFAFEWEISPDNPALSHLLNVLFYAISCSLLFIIFRRILPRQNILPALLASLLWLFHPVHTEVVANIKSRDEIMLAFFLFLSILSFLAYLKKNSLLYIAGTMAFYLLALSSKEGAITFLVIFPLIGWYFTQAPIKRNLLACAFLLMPVVIYFITRQSVLDRYATPFTVTAADNLLVTVPDSMTRMATAVMILGKYLLLLLFPYRLVCDYSYNQIPIVGWISPLVWLSFAVYAVAFVYAVVNLKRKSVVVFAILVYLITMSVYSNIFMTIGTSFAERLLFLPSVGFCLLAGVMIARLFAPISPINQATTGMKDLITKNKFVWLIAIVILSLFGIKTVARNAEWKDEWTLISADVKRSPNSAHMRYYHGIALRDKGKEQRDKKMYRDYMQQAIDEFDACVSILPTFVQGYEELGLAWFRMGNQDKALQYYDRALQLNSKKAATYSNMGIIFFERKDYARALELYKKAVSLDSNFENGHLNLGSIYGLQGKYDQAISHFEKVIRINPANAKAYYYLGLTYELLDQKDKSEQYYAMAGKLDPAFKK